PQRPGRRRGTRGAGLADRRGPDLLVIGPGAGAREPAGRALQAGGEEWDQVWRSRRTIMDRAGAETGRGDRLRRISANPKEGLAMFIAPLVWIVLAQVPATPLTGTVVGPGGEPVIEAELILAGLPS